MPSPVDQKKQEIEKEHPAYQKRAPQWARCRDVIEGVDAVKAAGEKYLPRLPGQDSKEYSDYKLRAVFYEATGRTLEGLSGLVMGKVPQIDAPPGAQDVLDDCDMRGRPFTALAEDAMEDVLSVGRFGILVDHPPKVEGLTKDLVEPLGLRPYVIRVPAENIINWEYSRIQNRWKLSRIVIRESVDSADGQSEYQYRELLLVAGTDLEGNVRMEYQLKTWTKANDTGLYSPSAPIIPEMAGKPLDKIPLYFAGVEFGDEDPDRPPLLGLVELNLHHYTTSADKRHALFHCGLPTPVFSGFDFKEGTPVKLGGASGISSTDPNASATYLEFTGQGIQPLQEEEEALEAKMAKMGARMLAEDKKAVETAEALKIRASGESSTLASIAESVSKTLTQVLAFICEWGGWAGTVKVQLNNDFRAPGLSAQEITSLTMSLQSGGIPLHEYLLTLMENGAIRSDRDNPVPEMEAELDAQRGSDGFSFPNNQQPPDGSQGDAP